MSLEQRMSFLDHCQPMRISTYGYAQWVIVHIPSGVTVQGAPETHDFGDERIPKTVSGPVYFPRKKDAQAALDKLRTLYSSASGAKE